MLSISSLLLVCSSVSSPYLHNFNHPSPLAINTSLNLRPTWSPLFPSFVPLNIYSVCTTVPSIHPVVEVRAPAPSFHKLDIGPLRTPHKFILHGTQLCISTLSVQPLTSPSFLTCHFLALLTTEATPSPPKAQDPPDGVRDLWYKHQ